MQHVLHYVLEAAPEVAGEYDAEGITALEWAVTSSFAVQQTRQRGVRALPDAIVSAVLNATPQAVFTRSCSASFTRGQDLSQALGQEWELCAHVLVKLSLASDDDLELQIRRLDILCTSPAVLQTTDEHGRGVLTARNSKGRNVRDLALVHSNEKIIEWGRACGAFLVRYRIMRMVHRSATCLVLIALDEQAEEQEVVLKLMKNRSQF